MAQLTVLLSGRARCAAAERVAHIFLPARLRENWHAWRGLPQRHLLARRWRLCAMTYENSRHWFVTSNAVL